MKSRKKTGTVSIQKALGSKVPVCSPSPAVGLDDNAVHLRTVSGLRNVAVESPTKTEKQIIRENCLTFFNLIFIILALCLLLVGSFGDMLFLGVAVANTAIGIFQEIRSKRTIDRLTLMNARKVPVIRNGKRVQIPSDKLVRDDIVEFAPGDQICADAVVRLGNLQVNESLITGEEDAISKRPGDVLLSGSFVVSGRCKAQLTRVGAESYASVLTLEAKKDVKVGNSEMMRALDRVIRVIGILMVPLGIGLFLKEYLVLELGLQDSVRATVAALIGMIPEGLYLLTSVALAVSVLRLAQKKVLTQDMNCIENLARVDVLCVDKTGTITESVMEPAEPVLLDDSTSYTEVCTILSEIYGASPPDNDTGRAMAEKFCMNPQWRAAKVIPFSSDTKWTGVIFEGHGGYLVGAPEFIMGARYNEVGPHVLDWSQRGYRVLLLAAYDGIPEPGNLMKEAITPLALIPLTNRIRPEAPETFRYFARQGVAIRVISGDNPSTVSEVARQAGIADADLYVDATTLKTEEDIQEAVEYYAVFGRVTPDQKRKLIRAMQAAGHTVAMTGDGVNDVLALKDADCGIAMASGAEAACQVAQLVLMDSDFSHMPDVVNEGRRVINNIQRAAALFFVKNIFSFLITVISLFVDMPYPLLPLHLSVISGLTIGIPAFFLALEPNHDRIKGKFITNVLLKALPGGLTDVTLILLIEGFFAVFQFPQEQLYTMSTVVMAVIGLRVLYQAAEPVDWKRALLIALTALALIVCFVPLRDIFDFTVPTMETGLVLLVLILVSFQIMRCVLMLFEKAGQLIQTIREKRQKSIWYS
ncbi:MAG: cation-translocating P-type ATPase [Oscillospiraceae bacterium]|nr:cation-translocating P-type ATPase [Oscillospiraceae bacterium]